MELALQWSTVSEQQFAMAGTEGLPDKLKQLHIDLGNKALSFFHVAIQGLETPSPRAYTLSATYGS